MKDFRVYEALDSTNKESRRLLDSGQNLHGTAILALHQTDGIGQYGRSWHATAGQHLAMSIILQPENMAPDELARLSMKTSIAVIRTLLWLDPGFALQIKWPNDIYASDQKLAGILIENSISTTKVQHSIIGIGMNVNESEFPSELPNPVSLFMLTGKKYEVQAIAQKLKEEVLNILVEAPENWKPVYDNLIYGLGKRIEFEWKGKKIWGTIEGVDDEGKLILDVDGERKSYFSHEIKWLK